MFDEVSENLIDKETVFSSLISMFDLYWSDFNFCFENETAHKSSESLHDVDFLYYK